MLLRYAHGMQEYYDQSRAEMLTFVPPDTRRLLDIGCGNGAFGALVKQRLGAETWGVEYVEAAAERARAGNDRILRGSIYEPLDLPEGYFDVITMNDVLEHLPESEPVLERVKRLLRPGGLFILSLPNVRYYLNVRDLVFRQDWQYQDFGILDRTHLRFFTQKSARRLLEDNGFAVQSLTPINTGRFSFAYRCFFALTLGYFEDMKCPQFAIVAAPIVP